MPVLIIDDDAAFRSALERDLRQCGYTVHVSAGFESMVNILLKVAPRAAIVDAHLAYGESRQAMMALHRCGIPVVLLSERGAPVDRWEGAKLTSEVNLTKPVGLVELEQCLKHLRPPTL